MSDLFVFDRRRDSWPRVSTGGRNNAQQFMMISADIWWHDRGWTYCVSTPITSVNRYKQCRLLHVQRAGANARAVWFYDCELSEAMPGSQRSRREFSRSLSRRPSRPYRTGIIQRWRSCHRGDCPNTCTQFQRPPVWSVGTEQHVAIPISVPVTSLLLSTKLQQCWKPSWSCWAADHPGTENIASCTMIMLEAAKPPISTEKGR